MARHWKTALGCSLAAVAAMAALLAKDMSVGAPSYGTPAYWLDFSLTLAAVVIVTFPALVAMAVDDLGGGDE